jgi:hypothetical protein
MAKHSKLVITLYVLVMVTVTAILQALEATGHLP